LFFNCISLPPAFLSSSDYSVFTAIFMPVGYKRRKHLIYINIFNVLRMTNLEFKLFILKLIYMAIVPIWHM